MKKAKKNRDRAALNSPLIRRPIQKCFWLFLLPTFAAFCIGFLYPFCKGLFLSFCDFKTTKNWTWVGIKNYIAAFQDKSFGHAFWYTALFAVVSLVLINVIAFAIAYALTRGIRGSNLFRTVFFMPNLIGGIVLGYIWSMIFNGILTVLLGKLEKKGLYFNEIKVITDCADYCVAACSNVKDIKDCKVVKY